jgi:hypothetical protein
MNASIVIVLGPSVPSHDLTLESDHQTSPPVVRQPMSLSADPGCGTGLTGRGTMVVPRLEFARVGDRAFRGKEGPGTSDKISDNGSRQCQT